MAVTYTTALKNSMLDLVTAAAGASAKLEIGTTGMPSNGEVYDGEIAVGHSGLGVRVSLKLGGN